MKITRWVPFYWTIMASMASVALSAEPPRPAAQATQSSPQPRYKAVDSEAERASQASSSGDYFQGPLRDECNDLFFGLGINYFSKFGIQGRYAGRLMHQVLDNIRNPLWLEGGAGLTFYGTVHDKTGVSGFHVVITGRWDFQMDAKWTFFGNLGLGYNAVSDDRKDHVSGGGFFPAAGAGAMYHFSPEWSLRADISYQFLGVGAVRSF